MRNFILFLLILVSAIYFQAKSEAYDYPLLNEYAATIIGTPEEYKAMLPDNIRIRNMKLTVFRDREIPEVFWYEDKLRYSLVYQKVKAPLIWIIAGTGAGYNASKMQILQKAFFQAGFHVISLTSPTHPNFIVSASSTMVPGHIVNDSKDLYHVMELIWEKVKDSIDVSEFFLTGYSLGAAQAAFVSKIDEDKRSFNFRKVYMINPPVNLYNSVYILDHMLKDTIEDINSFWTKMTSKFAEEYVEADFIEFNNEFFYNIYKKKNPPEEKMEALIGLSFRISSMNMFFATDVMTNAGYIIPKNLVLTSYSSLTDYFKVCGRTTFTDYFNDIFYPYYHSAQPDLTKKSLISTSMSLKSIEDYLKNAKKIRVAHNKDDIILKTGEIDFFRRVFGDRAKIYPRGGHCGNMAYKDNIAYMIDFFKPEGVR